MKCGRLILAALRIGMKFLDIGFAEWEFLQVRILVEVFVANEEQCDSCR